MDNRKEIAEKIITALTNRSGFDDLWYNLDEETQSGISDEIVNILPIHDFSKQSKLLPDFLYEFDGKVFIGQDGDTECTDAWNKWKEDNCM